MGLTDREKWGLKTSRFLKAELKQAGIGYKELAERLNKQGMEETETSVSTGGLCNLNSVASMNGTDSRGAACGLRKTAPDTTGATFAIQAI